MICTAYELFTNHECITCQLHCLRLLSGWLATAGFNPVCLEFLFLVHILLILFSHFIVKSFYLTVYYKLFICWLAWWTSIILSYPFKRRKKKCICCKFCERRIWRSRVIFYYHVINLFFTFQSFADFVLCFYKSLIEIINFCDSYFKCQFPSNALTASRQVLSNHKNKEIIGRCISNQIVNKK